MSLRRIVRLAAVSSMAVLLAVSVLSAQESHKRGRKYKVPPPTSRVDVTVLRGEDEKPLENAAVIFHLEGDKGNMELKTNYDGKTFIDVLPTGSKVLLQVIARGYQTYGQSFDVDKDQMAIEVKMNRPGKQYSIYEKHADTPRTGGTGEVVAPEAKDGDKPADAPAAAPESKDKPAEAQKDQPKDTPKPQ
ncbi:MAG TPA: hypothetical protein VF392_10160 [Terracidiphilus sp.]